MGDGARSGKPEQKETYTFGPAALLGVFEGTLDLRAENPRLGGERYPPTHVAMAPDGGPLAKEMDPGTFPHFSFPLIGGLTWRFAG